MLNNRFGETAMQQRALKLCYSILKLQQKSSETSKVLITIQKRLFKLILKSISKLPENSNL